MLKCIIVDDEFPAREELKFFITENKNFELVTEYENPLNLLKDKRLNDINVVFLDINMPELDGISVGKILKNINPNLKIIYISAYREYAFDAFELKAYDYV